MTGADFGRVDIDLLADYIGGALEGTPDESAVATLIAEDPAWRQAYDQLGGAVAEVRAELGRLEPEPMPTDLAAKLDGMFAPVPQLTVVPGGAADGVREKKRHRRMRWATPIAIAAGVVAFVGFGADYLAGRSSNDVQTDSAAGNAEGSTAMSDIGGDEVITATGQDYSRATLAAPPPPTPMSAPRSEAFASEGQGSQRATTLSADPALARLTARDALDECLAAIERENAGGPLAVQTVDYARFDGVPAVIVRFTAENGAWGWAAGADCGTPAGDADTIEKLPVR
ncbi:hypothetical protein Aab01nite_56870 [Paractinoplanes abujensis]|uniref:Uncharacterized protein n=1 Tax=Paractinoplanes abujensis TaxID=882441 RepID=A0A7W7CWT6_9ACTN|nr:hypothetical protein [Actinoplanes abujensis]MBB4696106.1 hypothetical protein [Actinoplanes abujensis]GID22097.1 hypothetical protein Aab01nite_56870 [Actinoplanes abujensis]